MPVIPTEIGSLIIEQAKKVVTHQKGIYEIIAQQKGDISGVLKIGIIPTIAPYLLHRFIRKFLEKYPHVKLQVEELITEETIKRLKNDELDAGIVVTPLEENGIVEKPIFYEKFFVYLSKDHPLLAKESLSTTDLETTDLWILQQGHCFRDQVLKLCTLPKFQKMNFHYESGSLEGLKNMVNQYKGVTLLPELATWDLSDEEKLRLRKFLKDEPSREISLVISRSYLKKKLIEILYNEISLSIPQEMTSKAHGKIVKFK
jgi:LysR family hydrogen peroxide-inducible transcriptional activator